MSRGARDGLNALFSTGRGGQYSQSLQGIADQQKGEIRLLLEELKKNFTLSWLVVNREVEPPKVIPQLTTKAYDHLLEEGCNFSGLVPPRRRIVRGDTRFADSGLAPSSARMLSTWSMEFMIVSRRGRSSFR